MSAPPGEDLRRSVSFKTLAPGIAYPGRRRIGEAAPRTCIAALEEFDPPMPHRVTCLDCALPGVHLVDIRSDRHFPRHAHDQFGVGVMLDGGHRSWSGRGPVEAGPNQVITVNPDEMHDGLPLRGATRHWRMLFVDPCVVADLAGADLATREFSRPVIDDTRLARRITAALRDLPLAIESGAECISELFGGLLARPGTAPETARRSRGVRLMLERMHDAPAEVPPLGDLAGVAGFTPFTAIRRFRRELGTTPHAYLVQYRVRRAQQAIGAGASLTEAALLAGFADQSHMTRAFVRQFGMTPGRWRPRNIVQDRGTDRSLNAAQETTPRDPVTSGRARR